MKYSYTSGIICILLVIFATPATAQFHNKDGNAAVAGGDEIEAAAEKARAEQEKQGQKDRWETVLASIRENARDTVIQHLDVVISEIDRSSSLKPDQELKLKLGAKGTADKAVEEWAANLEKQQGLIQQLEAMAANQIRVRKAKAKAEADKEKAIKAAAEKAAEQQGEKDDDNKDLAEGEEKKEADIKVDFDQLITQWGRQIQPATAENQTLWTATLDKTLTKDQKAGWEMTKRQRAEFGRSLQVAQAVQAADTILRFTNDQRQRFFELLNRSPQDKKAGGNAKAEIKKGNGAPQIVIQGNGGMAIQANVIINGVAVNARGNSIQGSSNGRVNMKDLKIEHLAEFLSEEQMKLWESILKNPKQIRNSHLFFGNARGGAQQFHRAINIQAIQR